MPWMVAWRAGEGKAMPAWLEAPLGLTYNPALAMPILDEHSLDFISHSPEQTQRLGVRLGELLRPGDVICLAGDLGSGKTTLAQGIARGWGAVDLVTSPTFVLINEYRRADSTRLLHVDAFRLEHLQEARSLGLTELLEEATPVLIEWPDRLEGLLPAERLQVTLQWADDSRRTVRMEARGARYERLLRQVRQAAFGG
jgi:tRNA threonylcarbamoyladenosine biosynthesis protein TsaE